MIKLKKFTINNIFEKGARLWGPNSGKLKVNGQLRINLYKSKTKDQNGRALNSKVDI